MSFAPLAGRLAAQAAELRPVDGSRDNLAKFMALVVCALLDMLVLVCEMLDARYALGARPVVASAVRVGNAASVPAPPAGRQATLGRARKVGAVTPRAADVSSETADAIPFGPWLAWSRDPGQSRPCSLGTTAPPRKAAFSLAPTHVVFVAIS